MESYFELYYSEVAGHAGHVLAELPTFVTGPHRVQVYLCREGMAVVSMPSDSFKMECIDRQNERTQAVVNGLDGFALVGPMTPPFDITMAGLTIQAGDGPEMKSTSWDSLHMLSDRSPGRWTSHAARRRANQDVAQMLASRLMNLPKDEARTVGARLQEAVQEFEALLDSDPAEEVVQQFLSEHPVLVDPTALSVRPKVRLGSEHITDFVVEVSQGEYELVEIEPPGMALYTKQGDPTARLSHAQRQVEDWRLWVSENIAYARTLLPDISEPRVRVIMGRRSMLTPQTERSLRRKNQELHRIYIETFDDLMNRAKRTAANLEKQ